MNYNQVNNTCFFNTLYIQYVEDIGRNEYFYYDLKYTLNLFCKIPVFTSRTI